MGNIDMLVRMHMPVTREDMQGASILFYMKFRYFNGNTFTSKEREPNFGGKLFGYTFTVVFNIKVCSG